MAETKWAPPVSVDVGLNDVTIVAGENVIGSSVATGRRRFLELDFLVVGAGAPTDGKMLEVYVLYSVDGTNYPDGGAGTDPKGGFVGAVAVRGSDGPQRPAPITVALKPFPYKVLLKSEIDIDVTVTVTAAEFNEQSE